LKPDRAGPSSGLLVLVSTPIGNLGDLSSRALETLHTADVVYCEDTRRTRVLLHACGVDSNPRRLLSLHEHNEASRIPEVLHRLGQGQTVALVSDAGTPGVSDPGERLVAAVAAAGGRVSSVPGPSAVTSALAVSGLGTQRFCFEGFLPRKGAERAERLVALASEQRTTVLLEAPGRLATTLDDLLRHCGDRRVVVARELTKVHEDIWRGGLEEAAARFADEDIRGEVTVVLGGAAAIPSVPDELVAAAVAERLAAGEGARATAEAVARELGVPMRRAYRAALAAREGA
jgi:16S rRNA (cytidine1402-2'-O)-methyltransferase